MTPAGLLGVGPHLWSHLVHLEVMTDPRGERETRAGPIGAFPEADMGPVRVSVICCSVTTTPSVLTEDTVLAVHDSVGQHLRLG